MDLNNPVIQLCIIGTQAEFNQKIDEAKACYQQAWQIQSSNFEACIAAHYMARFQQNPTVEFDWNKKALEFALACKDDDITPFLPSLYLNLGKSYEKLGDTIQARQYYAMAAQSGLIHQMDEK